MQMVAAKMKISPEPQVESRNLISISNREFELFQSYIYNNFGINLTDVKRTLLVNRLQRILRTGGFNSFNDYYNAIQKDKSGHGVSDLVDAVSTNHTFFFREKVHFDYLVGSALPNLVPQLTQNKSKDLRVWCAASSSGEEPYVLAMLMKEFLGSDYNQWSAGVLATDISAKALDKAINGLYPAESLVNVPSKFKLSYFEKVDGAFYRVKELLRKEVLFRRFNLMNENYPFKKPFHVIFCRNVMIYFDQKTREKLVNRLFQFTAPGGYLFIGNAETLGRTNSPYKYLSPSIYQRSN